jgi:hypothetical protein
VRPLSDWIVSPELHRRGGPERRLAEQLERWRDRLELSPCTMHAQDVDGTSASRGSSNTRLTAAGGPPGCWPQTTKSIERSGDPGPEARAKTWVWMPASRTAFLGQECGKAGCLD